MKPDIRSATCLVIRKDGEYLSRRMMLTGELVWDPHLSSAWTTRDKDAAVRMARIVGGTVYLFNKVIWRTKVL